MADFGTLFTQVNVDSSALTGLSAVAHKFDQLGDYKVNILKDSAPLHQMSLSIAPGGTQAQAPVHIDVAQRLGAAMVSAIHADRPNYVLFHAASGDTGYAVVAQPAEGAGQPFDSRQLKPSDIFSTLLVRPGTYTLLNTLSQKVGTITVSYPVVTPGVPYQPPQAVTIECNTDGFTPNSIELKPAQGLIIHINTPAHITINLTKPDDRR